MSDVANGSTSGLGAERRAACLGARAPSKDLARDYAAAEIERHAVRFASLADQVHSLRHQWHEVASVAATIQDVSTTASQPGDARAILAKAATRVYADPSQALERLAADSRAPERLSVGQAAAYGKRPVVPARPSS
jgi:hypothetical protein